MINFKISEFLKSETAKKYNINNYPKIEYLDNILDLILYCMQPIRNLMNFPIIITSGYRCRKLNELIGGVKNSQHLIGAAADFKIKTCKKEIIIEKIRKSNIEFDQLINEKTWIHISYIKNANRRQIID